MSKIGCGACGGDHNVRSCEDAKAVAYWRARAAKERVWQRAKGLADKYERLAANLERRLRGEPMPAGEAVPRLPR